MYRLSDSNLVLRMDGSVARIIDAPGGYRYLSVFTNGTGDKFLFNDMEFDITINMNYTDSFNTLFDVEFRLDKMNAYHFVQVECRTDELNANFMSIVDDVHSYEKRNLSISDLDDNEFEDLINRIIETSMPFEVYTVNKVNMCLKADTAEISALVTGKEILRKVPKDINQTTAYNPKYVKRIIENYFRMKSPEKPVATNFKIDLYMELKDHIFENGKVCEREIEELVSKMNEGR